MKTLIIGIAPYGDLKARTLAIARGTYKPSADEPKVWVTSMESVAKILSSNNQELLRIIAEQSPKSLAELAKLSGRKVSNLSRTLHAMEEYGFVELDRGDRGEVMPKALYDHVHVELELAPSR